MSVLYLTEQGGYVHKSGETIVIEKDGEEILKSPLKDISIIVIFGNVQVSVQALLALLEKGCDISMMTQDGHFRGRVVSALGKNIELREKQFKLTQDADFVLRFSKSIVSAKIKNGITLMQKYSYSDRNPFTAENLPNMKELIKKIEDADNIDTLRGYEGVSAKNYFDDFGKFLIEGIEFSGRKYFPAPDPVNALLSFGYSFVSRELQSILEGLGLDPYIGFFHQIKYGRASLSLDLTEEFRHSIVDRLVLRLLNKRILSNDDFYKDAEKGGCYLKRDALKVFLKYYEEYMDDENKTYGEKEEKSIRYIFWKQAENLRNAIQDSGNYEPYLLD